MLLNEIDSANSPTTDGVYIKVISWEELAAIVIGNWISIVISEASKTTSSTTNTAVPVFVNVKVFCLDVVNGIFSKSIATVLIDRFGVLIWKKPLYEFDKIFSRAILVIIAFDILKSKEPAFTIGFNLKLNNSPVVPTKFLFSAE